MGCGDCCLFLTTPVVYVRCNTILSVTDLYFTPPPVRAPLVAGHSLCLVDFPRCCASCRWQQVQIVVASILRRRCGSITSPQRVRKNQIGILFSVHLAWVAFIPRQTKQQKRTTTTTKQLVVIIC